MRKTTQEIVRAFRNHERKTVGNSYTDGKALFLHGNKIAEFRDGELWITNAGWSTNVTKERLNGLPGVSIYQSNFQWYLNGKEWNGEWINPATMETAKPEKESDALDVLGMASRVAKIGEIFCDTDEEKNAWKKRMLALVPGIDIPEDWDTLPEEEKKRRLDGAIKVGLEK